jgi:hypothetical protein
MSTNERLDPSPQGAHACPGGQGGQRARHKWRARAAAGLILAAVVTAGTLSASRALAKGASTPGGVFDNGAPTGLATVQRQDLSAQADVDATLGYAGSYSVVNQAQGTITWLPSVGQVVRSGQVLYRINGNPAVLLAGPVPAYRSLSEGYLASDTSGPDVAELNADLVALGYATTAEIPAHSDQFSWWTKAALERLQARLGLTQTGTLELGQAVFLPAAARIGALSAALGTTASPGQTIMTATGNGRQVSIALDAAQQSEVKAGDPVTITLPTGQTTPGVVSSVGKVATVPAGGGDPTIPVEVTPTDPAATGHLDQAPVQVTITTAQVSNAIVVPVVALLALSGGGYAVEVADADGVHHLVPVSLGLFDDADGLVQVTGSELSPGQRVVVPALS